MLDAAFGILLRFRLREVDERKKGVIQGSLSFVRNSQAGPRLWG